MKKIFVVILFAVLAISCSSDSNISNTTVLLKKLTYTSNGNLNPTEITYTYQGNKLYRQFKNGVLSVQYYYSENLIDHIEIYSAAGDYVTEVFIYTYDAQSRLIKALIHNVDLSEDTFKETYTYNSDGTVSVERYRFSLDNWSAYPPSKFFFDSNGEIVNKVYYLSNGTTHTEILSYDEHPNPFRNVVGFDKLLDQVEGMRFNLTSVENGLDPIDDVIKTYTYGSNEFPSQMLLTRPNATNQVTQYNYFY